MADDPFASPTWPTPMPNPESAPGGDLIGSEVFNPDGYALVKPAEAWWRQRPYTMSSPPSPQSFDPNPESAPGGDVVGGDPYSPDGYALAKKGLVPDAEETKTQSQG